jgi:hypothetical protein
MRVVKLIEYKNLARNFARVNSVPSPPAACWMILVLLGVLLFYIVAHRALRDEFNSAGRVILIKTPDARFNGAVFV